MKTDFISFKQVYDNKSLFDKDIFYSDYKLSTKSFFLYYLSTCFYYLSIENQSSLDKLSEYFKMENNRIIFNDKCLSLTKDSEWFIKWYNETAINQFTFIFENINDDNLDNRINSYLSIYLNYLKRAINNSDDDLILENLLIIPDDVRAQFSSFGFFACSHDLINEQIRENKITKYILLTSRIINEPDFNQALFIY